jgi:hypothetical protein
MMEKAAACVLKMLCLRSPNDSEYTPMHEDTAAVLAVIIYEVHASRQVRQNIFRFQVINVDHHVLDAINLPRVGKRFRSSYYGMLQAKHHVVGGLVGTNRYVNLTTSWKRLPCSTPFRHSAVKRGRTKFGFPATRLPKCSPGCTVDRWKDLILCLDSGQRRQTPYQPMKMPDST